jgi:hypothetical protein
MIAPGSCRPILAQMDWVTRKMPKSVAQLTGVIVCGIVTFGTDLELTYAMPLGILAGALAVFFVSVAEARQSYNARSQ